MEPKPYPVVFIIDDNRPDVYLLRIAVYNSGIEFVTVITDDGTMACDKCQRAGNDPSVLVPDVILLDLNLGGCTGFAVLQTVRANPQLKESAVVVVSGSDREDDIARSYELNANAYMFKTSDIEELFENVKNAVTFFLRTRE